jgi:acyl CoA:acetate/3-ketoacid CoA transferase beta subunit
MVSPFGSIPGLGARIAKATFSPDLVLTDGEAGLSFGVQPLNARSSELVREAYVPYRAIFSVVWSGRRHIMMMASQVDQFGNQNIAAIGPHDRPKAQLIGVRGAPGNSLNHPTSYWVPDHNPRSFVEHVDVVCGVGNDRAALAGVGATRFHDLRRVISNLGVFDFSGPDGSMAVVSLHPEVTADEVRTKTGFAISGLDGKLQTTRSPSAAEADLIERLDPKGARHRELPSS